jgi:hypothetical protein
LHDAIRSHSEGKKSCWCAASLPTPPPLLLLLLLLLLRILLIAE